MCSSHDLNYFNEIMWFLKDTMLPHATEYNFGDNETRLGGTIVDMIGASQIQGESQEDNDDIQTPRQTFVQHVPTDDGGENIDEPPPPDSQLIEIMGNSFKQPSSSSNRKATMIEIERKKVAAFLAKNTVNNSDVDDEDISFLKSLAPYFKGLNPVPKLRLRSKIQNLIADDIVLHLECNYHPQTLDLYHP